MFRVAVAFPVLVVYKVWPAMLYSVMVLAPVKLATVMLLWAGLGNRMVGFNVTNSAGLMAAIAAWFVVPLITRKDSHIGCVDFKVSS